MSERLPSHEDEPKRPVTIFELAEYRLKMHMVYGLEKLPERLTGADFEAVGLPFFGGCEVCEAGVSALNACPSKSGNLRCVNCIGDDGYDDVPTADFALFGFDDYGGAPDDAA